jgi:SAM-dependent methyltransferase
MSSQPPLHQLDPLRRFGNRASDYARFRPDYPQPVFDALFEGLTESASLIVADIGAGTGISSRQLAARGVSVLAVEPNAGMREAAEPHPGVRWMEGSAEQTGLGDGSVDVVTCFQAFHWFEPDRALAEFHRILRPTGRIALVWNRRDRADGFTAAYTNLVESFAEHPAAEERAGIEDPLRYSDIFREFEERRFRHSQSMTLEELLGRARSTSYLPKTGEAGESLMAGLEQLHRTWAVDGKVTLVYRALLYRAVPA